MKRQFLLTDTTCITANLHRHRMNDQRKAGARSVTQIAGSPPMRVHEGVPRHIILLDLSTPSVDRFRPPAYADSSSNATAFRETASNRAFRMLQFKLRENGLEITAHDKGKSYVPLLR